MNRLYLREEVKYIRGVLKIAYKLIIFKENMRIPLTRNKNAHARAPLKVFKEIFNGTWKEV